MKFVNYAANDTFDYELQRACKNCSNNFSGKYCNRCGEEVIESNAPSTLQILKWTFFFVPFLEQRFPRTLKLMITRPGFVSASYNNGIRVPFIKPVTIFILVNIFYFLLPNFQTLNSPLRHHLYFYLHNDTAEQMVQRKINEEHITFDELRVRYEQHAASVSKVLLIVFVFLSALIFTLINFSSKSTFEENFVLALEYNTLSVLLNLLLLPAVFFFFLGSEEQQNELFDNIYFSVVLAFVNLLIFYRYERFYYQQERKQARYKALLMIPGVFVVMQVYRAIVFVTTMLTL